MLKIELMGKNAGFLIPSLTLSQLNIYWVLMDKEIIEKHSFSFPFLYFFRLNGQSQINY